jgi:hypothetical protein
VGDAVVKYDVFAFHQATLAHAILESCDRGSPTGCHDSHNMHTVTHPDILLFMASVCLDG